MRETQPTKFKTKVQNFCKIPKFSLTSNLHRKPDPRQWRIFFLIIHHSQIIPPIFLLLLLLPLKDPHPPKPPVQISPIQISRQFEQAAMSQLLLNLGHPRNLIFLLGNLIILLEQVRHDLVSGGETRRRFLTEQRRRDGSTPYRNTTYQE